MIENTHERQFELLVKQMTWEADGVLSVSLVHPDGKSLPEWQPGAHIDLTLKGSLVRQYSLCGDPTDESLYRVAVLREQAALGGSEYVHEALRPGHRIHVAGPRNNFALIAAERYVFIAGGIGITPILGMIRLAESAGADWVLWYGGRRRQSMAFLDELESYGDRVNVVPEDQYGRLDLAAILDAPQDGTLIYCCGPEPLLAAVEERTASWPEGSLQVERFKARAVEAPAEGEQGFTVECHRSGRSVDVAAGCSIVDALASAGVRVPTSCRDGICGTCETKVVEGVPDHRDSVLSASEKAKGTCMMVCVSRSRTPRLVLDL
ncbi:PDR/VanB family oxidoreductase [Sinomonas sp. JGH33]|uniref:PDR/VanB family oxidoreductase n=1 Tax=Sinomonas terricola TaxID=3110330 RepID=A0ABU5T295_9MICC|nr:PDR/VanB family oxidoreductase [Sinomonas sp. JGH33]MEA5453758.1 PDR/VanB family oxidoreductase [Sinomonas sp. JGH33]